MSNFAVDEAYNNDQLEEKLEGWLTDARRVFHRGGVHAGIDRLVESAVRRQTVSPAFRYRASRCRGPVWHVG